MFIAVLFRIFPPIVYHVIPVNMGPRESVPVGGCRRKAVGAENRRGPRRVRQGNRRRRLPEGPPAPDGLPCRGNGTNRRRCPDRTRVTGRVRIVSGKWRGRLLRSPRGQSVRPTADRVREAVFNILGSRTEGARVLDLFAGTGALGLEALSRGAFSAVLVESAPRTFAVMRRNVLELGANGAEPLLMDYRAALRILTRRGSRFGLRFPGPPD